MCCGTAQNSYRTLAGVRVVLADGTVLDTRDAGSRAAFAATHRAISCDALDALARATRGDAALAARIRHKFRMKNTTGYSLNALVDFSDPIDILAHLMIGSEGTLGFISEITYRTVPEHPRQGERADPVRRPRDRVPRGDARSSAKPVDAVELADRAALRSVEGKPGLPAGDPARRPGRRRAARRDARAGRRRRSPRRSPRSRRRWPGFRRSSRSRFSTDPAECARLWNVRKGMFPSVGAMRATGTTVIIEDVAFPGRRGSPTPRWTCSDCWPRTATRRRSSSATRSKATSTSSSRRTSTRRPRSSATGGSWTRCAEWSSARTTARSRRSTAPAATWRRSSNSNGAPPPTR